MEFVTWDFLTGQVLQLTGLNEAKNGHIISSIQHVVPLISMELIRYYFVQEPLLEIHACGVSRKFHLFDRVVFFLYRASSFVILL